MISEFRIGPDPLATDAQGRVIVPRGVSPRDIPKEQRELIQQGHFVHEAPALPVVSEARFTSKEPVPCPIRDGKIVLTRGQAGQLGYLPPEQMAMVKAGDYVYVE